MIHIIKKHTVSVTHALEGVIWAFHTQPNFKIHLVVSLFVVAAGIFFKLLPIEWIILVLTITIGLVVEMINTAIEEATDAIDLKIRPDIKIAKDVSAGAMLVYAVGAMIIGCMIFFPKIPVILNF